MNYTEKNKMFRLLFHSTVVVMNLSCICYDQMYVDLPFPNETLKNLPLKGRIIFLTFCCVMLQTAYHFIALLNDIAGSNSSEPKRQPIIRRIKDSLFPTIFSTNIYVSLLFWGIYLNVDKKMLEPLDIEKFYHPLMNHVMHSTGTLFVFIELLTSNINFPSRKIGFSILYTYLFAYVTWFFSIYYLTGNWVYPMCEYTSTAVVTLVIVLGLVLMGGFYVIGEKLNIIVRSTKGNATKTRVGERKRK